MNTTKYLEIAKKTFSGTLGANLLELEFDRSDNGIETKYLLTLRTASWRTRSCSTACTGRVIENYQLPDLYLVVVYHDVYDVPSKATSGEDRDGVHRAVCVLRGAVCPVELAKPARSASKEDENRIGAQERDWSCRSARPNNPAHMCRRFKPATCQRRDVYVKTGRPSHPEFIERARLCRAAQTPRTSWHSRTWCAPSVRG